MPSPHPLPTEQKRRRGNPGKRKLNDAEPKPPAVLPPYPEHMPTEGRVIWETVGSYLLQYGFITTSDMEALADYVELELLNRQLTAEIHKSQPIVVDVATPKKNPLWTLKLEYLRERRAQHVQFGMTPSARSKIISTVAEDEDPIESALH